MKSLKGLDYEQRGPPPWLKKSKHWRLKAVEAPLARFSAFWLNLIVVSELALACCIGNTTAADSIATAAMSPNITIVEFFILIRAWIETTWTATGATHIEALETESC
jgi:hypothetical protein